jgi:molecular chaperone GrpE
MAPKPPHARHAPAQPGRSSATRDKPAEQAAANAADIIRAMDEPTPPTATERERTPETEAAELRRELQEQQDRLLRALAETENVRRRAERTADERVKYANEGLLRDVIPVLDNLDRALAAARAAGGTGGVVDGIELIQRELLRVLERHGVSRYSAVGQPFDPARHEAIARVVSTEAASGSVVAETAPGYLLNGRVLRAALVAVAAAPDEDAA